MNPIRTLLSPIALLLCAACVLPAPATSPVAPATPYDAFGPFLDSLMREASVPGLAFAVFDDSGIRFEHVSGRKSDTSTAPIDGETAFEAASISKPLFAYIVMSLERDGVLDRDAPLSTLASPLPEIGYDPRSAALTPRMLLSHRSGLPNWRARINLEASSIAELFPAGDTLRFVNDPGARYRYSGEGYLLLQRAVEQRTGRALNDLARGYIFGPLGMSRSSFQFDTLVRQNYAFGHDEKRAPDKWRLSAPMASSTLHSTASDLARFGARLATDIRAGGLAAGLAEPAEPIAVVDGVERSWGAGLGVVTADGRRYVYHTGNNVIFIADFVYAVDENRGYVLLTNSANGQVIADALERRFIGRMVRK